MALFRTLSSRRFPRRQSTWRPPRAPTTCRRRNSSNTYYDSQSGMHVPIHNENEIHVYQSWFNSFPQLYKNSDEAFEAKESLDEVAKEYSGVFLSNKMLHRRDERNLETLLNIMPSLDGFLVFAPPLRSNDTNNQNVVVSLSKDDALTDKLKEYKQQQIPTCIMLDNDSEDVEPYELANQVANVMDESGGGNFLSVSTTSKDEDSILRVCEELSYLDVPGPTIKSRLILDISEGQENVDNLVDEVMMMGVNKFVVSEEQQSLIQSVANGQGKQLIKTGLE